MKHFRLSKVWIPNSFTMGNLLFGFIAIVNASQERYAVAGICILFAALLDGFDGQIARMLRVTSKIGEQLDSLADCVAFGIAPGYLAYSAYLSHVSFSLNGTKYVPVGMFIAAAFPLCAAYRLARFNVGHDSDSFSGLPSPIAGIVMALVPIAFSDPGDIRRHLLIFVPAFIAVALLMVSTVKFSKPQAKAFNKIHGLKLVLLIVLIVLLSIILRKWLIFISIGLILIYIFTGLYSFLIQFIQDRRY
ncbi:MAG TPA: CDP-diacylglycerol--serine O-phosphatidyltransferase [Syntrophales bacterium]